MYGIVNTALLRKDEMGDQETKRHFGNLFIVNIFLSFSLLFIFIFNIFIIMIRRVPCYYSLANYS